MNLEDKRIRRKAAVLTTGVVLVALLLVHSRLVYRLLPNPPNVETLSEHQKRMLRYHLRGDAIIPAGKILFFGDSVVLGLPISAVLEGAVNYGIGGDSTFTLLQRLPNYQSLSQASIVVFSIGINDVLLGESDTDILARYTQILDTVPPHIPVLCSGLLPTNKTAWQVSLSEQAPDVQRLISLNAKLEQLCETKGANFVLAFDHLADKQGELRQELHVGDGLHLNADGNRILAMVLCKGLTSIEAKPIGKDNAMIRAKGCEMFQSKQATRFGIIKRD